VTPTTVTAALAAVLQRDPARPLITHVGPDGERVELSVRTFENNLAKAANLLRDDGDVGPGTRVAVNLPLHWQTAVWVGACALVGGVALLLGDPARTDVEVSVVGPQTLHLPFAPLTLATSLHPFGLPFTTPLAPGLHDVATEVRAHADRFVPGAATAVEDVWLEIAGVELTQLAALAEARDLAERLGLPVQGRLLCARPLDEVSALALVAVPLVMDASVVLLTDPLVDADDVAARERCDAVLR
jgi:uncharacterized protein (TIGR03089 family)